MSGSICCRIFTLSLMGIVLTFLTLATMSTHWREDYDTNMDVLVTIGLWRICRDIRSGSIVDHKCLSNLANDAPGWFQCVRWMMVIALLLVFSAFASSVYIYANLPWTRKEFPPQTVTLVFPAFIMMFAAGFALVAVSIFMISNEGIYFLDGLSPTWANSWGQVWLQYNSIPRDSSAQQEMTMSYGYSFALACVSVIGTIMSFIINCIASMFYVTEETKTHPNHLEHANTWTMNTFHTFY